MAQKFVGVDLGSHHIKVAVVSSGIRGVTLTDAFEVPVGHAESDDPEADPLGVVISVALNTLRERRLLGEAVGLVLPPGLLSYRVLSFPFTDERRIAQAVGFEAEGQFPVPLEELTHGHLVVPSSGSGGRALLAAVRRERVEQIAGIFRRAGSDLKHVTSGAISLAHLADPSLPAATPEMNEKGLAPCSLLVDIGHQTTQLVALGAKGPLAIRGHRRGGRAITQAIAKAYGLDPVAAEAAKHRDAFVPHRGLESLSSDQLESGTIVAKALEPIVREIGHTRIWLRATYNLEVGKIILAGGSSELRGLDAYLSEQLSVPIERYRPKAALVKGTEGRSFATLGPALGAAFGAARRPLMQLLDDDSSSGDGGWVQERMMSLVAIGVAVLAFGALDTVAQVKAIEAEQTAWESELEEATTKTFGAPLQASEVAVKLASVEGEDLTSLIPQRGALEVLAMVTAASTPKDLDKYPQLPAPAPPAPSGDGGDDEGDDTPIDEGGIDPATGVPMGDVPTPLDPATGEPLPAPTAPEEGIGVADNLSFAMVDIRERKVELKASASYSSTQDRLVEELKKQGCLQKISKGKVKDSNDLKSFEMAMDNVCFRWEEKKVEEEPEAEGGDEPAEPAAGDDSGGED
jgi:type IV pilus assembly protein PilM